MNDAIRNCNRRDPPSHPNIKAEASLSSQQEKGEGDCADLNVAEKRARWMMRFKAAKFSRRASQFHSMCGEENVIKGPPIKAGPDIGGREALLQVTNKR